MCAESIVTRLTDRWTSAVLKLGHGRGFVVSYGKDERAIITDAHCLPTDEAGRLLLPPAHKMSHEERIYPFLLARIGGAEAIVEAQCLFVDPIANIAALGPPGEEGSDRFNAYQKVVNDARTLVIIDAPDRGPARILALEGRWVEIVVERRGYTLVAQPREFFAPGVSGSPIVSAGGNAIGVARLGKETGDDAASGTVLVDCLPGRFLRRR